MTMTSHLLPLLALVACAGALAGPEYPRIKLRGHPPPPLYIPHKTKYRPPGPPSLRGPPPPSFHAQNLALIPHNFVHSHSPLGSLGPLHGPPKPPGPPSRPAPPPPPSHHRGPPPPPPPPPPPSLSLKGLTGGSSSSLSLSAGSPWDPFRGPSHKEKFSPSPLSSDSFQLLSKPGPSLQGPKPLSPTPIVVTDDDKGPIHTIPAPNLSLGDKPRQHIPTPPPPPPVAAASANAATVYGKPGASLPLFPSPGASDLYSHELLAAAAFGGGGPLSAVSAAGVAISPAQGYEVHEPSNDHAGYTIDGQNAYYAPDPDPSLPAPKVPETTDPHSLPSNARPPPELLRLSADLAAAQGGAALTSQDLLQLLGAAQQHGLHGVAPSGPGGIPSGPSGPSGPSTAHFFIAQPQLHSFNYQEQYPNAIARDYDEDAEGSESQHSYSTVRKTPESGINALNKPAPTPPSPPAPRPSPPPPQSTSNSQSAYYSSLPNRQAAEALATLAERGAQAAAAAAADAEKRRQQHQQQQEQQHRQQQQQRQQQEQHQRQQQEQQQRQQQEQHQRQQQEQQQRQQQELQQRQQQELQQRQQQELQQRQQQELQQRQQQQRQPEAPVPAPPPPSQNALTPPPPPPRPRPTYPRRPEPQATPPSSTPQRQQQQQQQLLQQQQLQQQQQQQQQIQQQQQQQHLEYEYEEGEEEEREDGYDAEEAEDAEAAAAMEQAIQAAAAGPLSQQFGARIRPKRLARLRF